ncbi:MAG: GTP-binding protein [Thermoplasmata archaeon]|nr:GTP-binding protein [Thermoplasmata archaeon]MCI4359439.1 GTP-binding protein [Thermoplasmata archaeon]
MSSLEEQITEVEDEIRNTQYNKATQHHIGRLKAKLAVLRLERETRAKGKGGGLGYAVRKSGHATVGLVGYPSVGKSTLLTALTGAASEAAAYDFTTVSIIPGMLRWGGASIQILDMPGLVPGAAKGRGRGREVLSVVRSVDLILFMIDPDHTDFWALRNELEGAGVRINGRPPKIVITRADRGGLTVTSTVKLTHLAGGLASPIAREFGLHNGQIVFREDSTPDDLIDALAGNRVYIPAILTVNKADLMTLSQRVSLAAKLRPFEVLFTSARDRVGLRELVDGVGRALAFIRIYMKPPGKPPDREEPVILRRGQRVAELLIRLPGELDRSFKAAQIWGPSARFPGQTVGREHVLADEDVVTVVVQRGSRGA